MSLNDLFEAARQVQAKAYAPYSRFKVGAAVRVLASAVALRGPARRVEIGMRDDEGGRMSELIGEQT